MTNFKQIKALKTKKGRDEQGSFIIEGEKLVAEIPLSWIIHTYVCADSYIQKAAQISLTRAPILTISDSQFASLSDTVTPQGIMAVCKKRSFSISDIKKKNPFILMGERLSDPGNIGTLIRTAAAADASGCVLSAGSGDIYNPKTIRASAGAILHIPIVEGADLRDIITFLKRQGIMIIAAHLQGAVLPYDLDLCQGVGILIGNEAQGLSDEVSDLADVCVKLPMASDIESLNASVAGGILFYEVVRQRLSIAKGF